MSWPIALILSCVLGAGAPYGTGKAARGDADSPGAAEIRAGASFDEIVGVARLCGRGATGLRAARTINVGRVAYANNLSTLFIGYQTAGDWFVREVHLEVVADPSDFPMNENGTPRIGEFRFHQTFETPTQEAIFQFSLSQLGFDPGHMVFIAAHAVVVRIVGNEIVQEETAWGKGARFGRGSWATYDDYRLGVCR